MEVSVAGSLSRDTWVDAALDVLAERGIDAVGVEPLARRLGVTKGSFYWHFRDRGALLSAMLRRWEEVSTVAVRDEVEAVRGGAEAKLRTLFAIALGSLRMVLETSVRQWARHEPRARRSVERVDELRMRYLQALFEELGLEAGEARARSFLAYSTLLGDHFITSGAPRRELLDRCTELLLRGVPRTQGGRRRR